MAYKKYMRPRRKIMRRKAAARKPRVSKTIKRYVKRVIHANQENKFTISVVNNADVAVANATAPYNQNVGLVLGQGTGRSNRIGTKVRVMKASIRGHISLKPYNATTNSKTSPIAVKMYLVSFVQQNPTSLPAVASTGFFNYVTGSTGWGGSILDHSLSVSSEDVKVLATKTIRLGITASTSLTSGAAWNDNSKSSAPFYFNFTKHYKGKLLFPDSATASYCNNKNIFLIVSPVYSDLTTAAASQVPCAITSSTEIEFEDA